jgi:F0F1-type ATP synthase membrane subunit b/b'
MQQEIVTAEADMKHILALLEEEEAKTKQDALVIQKNLEKDGIQKAQAAVKEAIAEIERLKVETSQAVQQQILDVKHHLAEESEKLSRVIMEKALDRSLSHE